MEQSVEIRLGKLEAARELENMAGIYCHLLFAGKGMEIMERLWSKGDDVSIEIGASGKYCSRKKVSTFYEKDLIPGKFQLLMPSAPVISLSDDGKEGTGLWILTQFDTDSGDLGPERPKDPDRRKVFTSRTEEGEEYLAEISLWKLEIHFRKEEEGWKICSLRQYDLFRFPCGSDWVRFAEKRFETDGMRLDSWFTSNRPFGEEEPPENLASRPTEYHWQYKTDACPQLEPSALYGSDSPLGY